MANVSNDGRERRVTFHAPLDWHAAALDEAAGIGAASGQRTALAVPILLRRNAATWTPAELAAWVASPEGAGLPWLAERLRSCSVDGLFAIRHLSAEHLQSQLGITSPAQLSSSVQACW